VTKKRSKKKEDVLSYRDATGPIGSSEGNEALEKLW